MTVLTRFRDLYKELSALHLDQLEVVYHPDVVFVDPVVTHTGLQSVKLYFARLLDNAQSCEFAIHSILKCATNEDNIDNIVTWTMTLRTPKLNRGKTVTIEGTSLLRIEDDRIIYHRDYYDVGAMVYENVPVIGRVIKYIKRNMAA